MATDCISSNKMLKNRAVWNRTKSGYLKAARPADLGLSTRGIFFDGARERHRRNYNPTMLLTITSTHRPATDLGYLLHKNPAKVHSFELSFGKVHVFYPETTPERCTAALLLDVDPVGLVRGKRGQSEGGTL